MHKISGKDLEKLIPLLKEDSIEYPITLGVLDGTFSGYAVTDRAKSPSKALVFHEYAGFIHYIGGEPLPDEVRELTRHAIEYKSGRDYCNWVEFAHCPESVSRLISAEIEHIKSYERISWNHDRNNFLSASVPFHANDCRINLISAEDLKYEFLANETKLFWKTTSEFLENAMGTAAYDADGNFIGFCSAVSASDHFFEINIEVVENYRRRGIGYWLGHKYIEECYKLGMLPHWDCYDHNTASQALARKLGFIEAGRYPLISWIY